MTVSSDMIALIDDFDAGIEPFGEFSAKDGTGEACADDEELVTQGTEKLKVESGKPKWS